MGRIGRRIADRYRLVAKLGTGGMSEVWRGYDETLGRDVAVKILSPRLAADDAFRDRMRQEALAAARLCHPHITSIFDFGESPLTGDLTVPFVVMELNDGESVAARVRRAGALAWRDAVTCATEVASALATAHAGGVVHRDITPANVMLTRAGAKVVDFGISALVGQRDAAPDGSLLGTPAYLAPERLGGVQVSPATDVYALGVLLYRTLTGRLPWPAENTAEALRAHLYVEPEPLPDLPGLPAEVADLCLRCLAKSPADRPPAVEVATRLGALVGLHPIIPSAGDEPTAPLSRTAREPALVAMRRTLPESVCAVLGLRPPRPLRPHTALRSLRLRAGMRVLTALRVGAAKPLGGGLFRGGQVRHDLFSGRFRLQAGAVTFVLLGVIGLAWSVAHDPAEVGPAQASAAGAGPPAGVVHAADCAVRYRVEKDTGAHFEARVTVVNTGDQAVGDWRMEFAYPGTQRLTEPARAVAQKGRKVVFRGRTELDSGRSASVVLRGAYKGSNPLPLAFTLDGRTCKAEVVGARTVEVDTQSDTDLDAEAEVTAVEAKPKAKATPRPAPSTRRTGRATGERATGERKKPATPSKKPVTEPAKPKVEKAEEPPPPPVRVGGFSVAI